MHKIWLATTTKEFIEMDDDTLLELLAEMQLEMASWDAYQETNYQDGSEEDDYFEVIGVNIRRAIEVARKRGLIGAY